MEDRALASIGMEYSQRTMEVWDDVIQALLAALSGKSGTGQKHILEQFAEYVKAGGTIKAVRFDEEHLADFHAAARELGLMYYAIRDVQTKQAVILIRDCDTMRLNQVAENLAKRGKPLYPNPQLSVSQFLEKNEKEEILFCRAESLEKIEAAKWEAANRKMEFAIGKQQDGSYIVIFRKEDTEDLREIGIIHKDALVSKLFRVSDIEDVRQIVQEQRKDKEAEKETEKPKQKNHGR